MSLITPLSSLTLLLHLSASDNVRSATPQTRHVRGSNNCFINVVADRVSGRAILMSAIDNLVKGASGQAIQNMNLMLGFPETQGLTGLPVFP